MAYSDNDYYVDMKDSYTSIHIHTKGECHSDKERIPGITRDISDPAYLVPIPNATISSPIINREYFSSFTRDERNCVP